MAIAFHERIRDELKVESRNPEIESPIPITYRYHALSLAGIFVKRHPTPLRDLLLHTDQFDACWDQFWMYGRLAIASVRSQATESKYTLLKSPQRWSEIKRMFSDTAIPAIGKSKAS